MSSAASTKDLPKPGATTDADKAENRTAFIRDIVGIRAPKKKDEPAGEKPGDKPAEKPADKPVEKPAAVSKKKPVAKAAPVSLSTEDLATAVSSGVREALKPVEKEKPAEPKVTDKLSEKDKKRFAVFEEMEKKNPANAGLSKKFVESLNKQEEYKKAWEAKNSGKKFNLSDDEHADFIANNDLNWDHDEYEEAKDEMLERQVMEKMDQKYSRQFSESKNQQAMSERAREEAPLVLQHRVATAKILFKNLGDEFSKVLGDNGVINTDEINRLCEENPIYLETVFPMARKVEEFSGELLRIARGHVPLLEKEPTAAEYARMNPNQRSQLALHKEIVSYVTNQERVFEKLPEEQKLNGKGQTFTTSDKWEAMTPAQRAKHWVLTDREISALYATDAAVTAKKSIEKEEGKFKKLAEKRGINLEPKPKSDKPAEKQAEKPADKLGEDDAAALLNRKPPASTVAPRMAPKPADEKIEKTASYKELLGRR